MVKCLMEPKGKAQWNLRKGPGTFTRSPEDTYFGGYLHVLPIFLSSSVSYLSLLSAVPMAGNCHSTVLHVYIPSTPQNTNVSFLLFL